jgi:hypothetical protein
MGETTEAQVPNALGTKDRSCSSLTLGSAHMVIPSTHPASSGWSSSLVDAEDPDLVSAAAFRSY